MWKTADLEDTFQYLGLVEVFELDYVTGGLEEGHNLQMKSLSSWR